MKYNKNFIYVNYYYSHNLCFCCGAICESEKYTNHGEPKLSTLSSNIILL